MGGILLPASVQKKPTQGHVEKAGTAKAVRVSSLCLTPMHFVLCSMACHAQAAAGACVAVHQLCESLASLLSHLASEQHHGPYVNDFCRMGRRWCTQSMLAQS